MNLWIDGKLFAHARVILARGWYLFFDNSWGDVHADFTFRMHPIESFNQTIEDDVIAVWWQCFFYFLDLIHNEAMI